MDSVNLVTMRYALSQILAHVYLAYLPGLADPAHGARAARAPPD
jgi:hypothetical protein